MRTTSTRLRRPYVLAIALLVALPAAWAASWAGNPNQHNAPVGAATTDGPAALSGSAVWDATDVRVNDPATQFDGDQKSLYEPHVAIDPTDPSRMVSFAIDLSTQNVDGSYSTNRAYRSTDSGASWLDIGPMPYRAGDAFWNGGDPVTLFTPDGVAYFASLAWPSDTSEGGAYVHRSEDGGATWQTPVQVVENARNEETNKCIFADKEWLSHDAATGTLYLAYSEFRYDCTAIINDPAGAANLLRYDGITVKILRSTDGGATWSPARPVWEGWALGAVPRVTADGTILMSFWANVPVPASPTACPSELGVVATALLGSVGTFEAILVGRSTDGGETWDFHQQDKCTFSQLTHNTKPGLFFGGNLLPALSVDASTGIAYVVWPQFLPSENRFTTMLISSADSGATWSDPVDLTPGTEDARTPTVFASHGAVRVAYLISRDSDNTGDAAYVESLDGGATWSDRVLLSTEPWPLEDGPDLGDYIGIDVQDGRIVVVWTDARKGDVNATEIWARAGSVAP